jgi:hypothetical protein
MKAPAKAPKVSTPAFILGNIAAQLAFPLSELEAASSVGAGVGKGWKKSKVNVVSSTVTLPDEIEGIHFATDIVAVLVTVCSATLVFERSISALVAENPGAMPKFVVRPSPETELKGNPSVLDEVGVDPLDDGF